MPLLISKKRQNSLPDEFRGTKANSSARRIRDWVQLKYRNFRLTTRTIVLCILLSIIYFYGIRRDDKSPAASTAVRPSVDGWSDSNLDTLTMPLDRELIQNAARTDASETDCPLYSPGLLAVDSIGGRSFCFGSTSLPGQRTCDRFAPDFGQPLEEGKEWLGVKVREQAFLIHPWLHVSTNTVRNREDFKAAGTNQRGMLSSPDQITLATQGSFNRVGYLNPLAQRWQGPISLALLLDDRSQLQNIRDVIRGDPLIQQWVDVHVAIRLPKNHGPVSKCGTKLPGDYLAAAKEAGLQMYLPDLTMAGGQFLYKCVTTCVGFGHPFAHCYKEFNVCVKEEYGSIAQQVGKLAEALGHPNHTHTECPMKDDHYPVNMLRNVAQQNIETGWVMPLDIDVIPSSCMAHYSQSCREAEAQILEEPTPEDSSFCPGLFAFIPPAIEMSKESLDNLGTIQKRFAPPLQQECATISKAKAVEAMYNKLASPMHSYFHAAYIPTNHVKWMKSGEDVFYEVPYTMRFEPYYIARAPIPMFNPGFVDRGGNFAQQTLEMYTAGYRFFVIPDAFLVDIPHTEKGPAQTDDNHKLSNALWKSFYRFVPNRYGIDGLPPYKGPEYREMRDYLAEMAQEFFNETDRLDEFKGLPPPT